MYTVAMQMTAYLSFKGDCEAAFTLYSQCLCARVGRIFRYGGTPFEVHVPAGWSDKVMHGSVTIGDQELMGADVAPDRYEAPKGFSLSLQMDSPATRSGSLTRSPSTAGSSHRSRKPSGRSDSAWWSIASASNG